MKITSLVKKQPTLVAPKNYLTFIAAAANSTIKLIKNGSPTNINVYIRRSEAGYWEPYTFDTDILLQNVGDYVLFKGYGTFNNSSFSTTNYYQFVMTGLINSQGNLFTLYNNIKSLILYNCYRLFYECSSLITPPLLPVITLANNCYDNMFYNCTSLITAPNLPAMSIGQTSYQAMFYGCTSLVTAPDLPATSIAGFAYQQMFQNCTSLVTAPLLPALTATHSCYAGMFRGCTSLIKAPELPASTLQGYCPYTYMFAGCTSLTTPPSILPATALVRECYANMFNGCTSLSSAPKLPAINLAYGCYSTMFYGCTSLSSAPVLPATTLTTNCYNSMFRFCINLSSIEVAFTDWNTSGNSTIYWVHNIKSTGIFTCPESLLLERGLHNIPNNWIIKRFDLHLNNVKVTSYSNEQANLSSNSYSYNSNDLSLTFN